MNWLEEKTSVRSRIKDFNGIIKDIYSVYKMHNGVAIPASMEMVKSPMVFNQSYLVWTAKDLSCEELDGMQDCIVDPVMLSRAIMDRCTVMEDDEENPKLLYMKDGKSKEKFQTSIHMTEKEIDDIGVYIQTFALNALESGLKHSILEWHMDEITKEKLIDYQTVPIELGTWEKKPVRLIATVKLFPGIKKCNDIIISAELFEDGDVPLYRIAIVTEGKDWFMCSRHIILNY